MDFNLARENMVEGQLRPNKVNNPALIKSIKLVARENFVDSSEKEAAYNDSLIAMCNGRYMFAPLTCARLLQALDLNSDDNVLVVAAGSGYSTILAASYEATITAVEDNASLLDIAKRAALDNDFENITFVKAKPETGYKKNADYSKIIIDSAVEEVPNAIIDQLKEGGVLVAVIKNEKSGILEATRCTKNGRTIFKEGLFETKGQVLENFKKEKGFVF